MKCEWWLNIDFTLKTLAIRAIIDEILAFHCKYWLKNVVLFLDSIVAIFSSLVQYCKHTNISNICPYIANKRNIAIYMYDQFKQY